MFFDVKNIIFTFKKIPLYIYVKLNKDSPLAAFAGNLFQKGSPFASQTDFVALANRFVALCHYFIV